MKPGINDYTGSLVPPEQGRYERPADTIAEQNAAFHYPRRERRIVTRAQPDCPQCYGVRERCGIAAGHAGDAGAEAWNWRRCPHADSPPDFYAFEDVPDHYQPRTAIRSLGQDAEIAGAFDGDGDGRRARAFALRMEAEARAAGQTVLDYMPEPGTTEAAQHRAAG